MKSKSLLTISASTMPIVIFTTVSCSLFGNESNSSASKLEFYNYQDYISDDDLSPSINSSGEIIRKFYQYQTFGDLPEFETYIKQERSVGGVGSDYFNASLAERGYLRKIDLSRIFDLPGDRSLWTDELEKIYTPEAWKILNAFTLYKKDEGGNYLDQDDNIVNQDERIGDLDGDGIDDYLWEYMIPYFAQNKVLAFNPWSENFDETNADVMRLRNDATNQNDINNIFSDRSYQGMLNKISAMGGKTFVNNDYMRDNIMIGAEKITGAVNGHVDSIAQGKKWLDAYQQTIADAHLRVTAVNTSGTETLRALMHIDHKNPIADAGFMYNGDSLYGYYGGDVTDGVAGELRIVVPNNSTYLLDGIIMVKSTTENIIEINRFYDALYYAFFQGAQTSYPNNASFASNLNMVYQNFDYVNYTPAYTNVHKYMEDQNDGYFVEEGILDEPAYAMGMATRAAAGINDVNIDDLHLAQVIKSDWTSQLRGYNERQIAILG